MLVTLGLLCSLAFSTAYGHMSIFHPSVYGFSTPLQNPLGPGLASTDDWWFRGPAVRAEAPTEVFELQAGGTASLEIACNRAWTSYGNSPTTPGSHLDACPTAGGAGPYHADPAGLIFNQSWVAGCALGIADKDNIEDVTTADIAIFSVQQQCVTQKVTSFDIPAQMPPCSGSKCICGWFWQPSTGSPNFYMTAFDCVVTGSPAGAKAIAPPQPPTWCDPAYPNANQTCVSGSKQPLYVYNNLQNPTTYPNSVQFNNARPGYHSTWSYNNGAQNDIFGTELATGAVVPVSGATSSISVTPTAQAAATPVTSVALNTTPVAAPVRATTQSPAQVKVAAAAAAVASPAQPLLQGETDKDSAIHAAKSKGKKKRPSKHGKPRSRSHTHGGRSTKQKSKRFDHSPESKRWLRAIRRRR